MTGHSSPHVAGAVAPPGAGLSLENISHSYGAARVLEDVNLAVRAGEIVCLLGASGSGKSTLLRIVAGLEPLQHGVVRFDGAELARPGREPPPEERRFGFVFQDHVLFPHLSVADNVAFGLPKRSPDARRERVLAQLRQVGLEAHERRYPHTLSGGEQQRVALARALAPEPAVMLLDEPFASVDSTLRRRLREDARRALRASGVPSIVVTHDAEEAMELADRIAVIDAGTIVQDATPAVVWREPADRFVAEMFNDTGAVAGRGVAGGVETPFGRVEVAGQEVEENARYAVIARAGSVRLAASPAGGARVVDVRFLGDRHVVTLEAGGERLRVLGPGEPDFAVGATVAVAFDSARVLVYHAAGSTW